MPIQDVDGPDLPRAAAECRQWLKETKEKIGAPEDGWYAYDTLGVFACISRLLGEYSLSGLAGFYPVIDIGAGDGDLAFFLESLGYQVHAADYPGTNANRMRGLLRLRGALESKVEVAAIDLEGPFELPAPRYGLAFCLGVLYHLKNPYHVLEGLVRKVRHLVLSTRVAEFSPDHRSELRHLPVAYLVGSEELNEDPTNYWIFSEAGLKKILARTGWELLSYLTVGCPAASDPLSADGDQRAYCLLRSRFPDAGWSLTLMSGWHGLERHSWRWTARRFSIRVRMTQPERPRRLELNFKYPEEQFRRLGAIRLSGRANGAALAPQTFSSPGEHIYAPPVPADAGVGSVLDLEFELDKAFGPTAGDARELGVIVVFTRNEAAPAETHTPLRLVFE